MLSILTLLTKSTGTSFPLPTLMDMPTHFSLTECGGRPGALKMVTMTTALVWTLTETGIFIGEVTRTFQSPAFTSKSDKETGVGHQPCDETWPGTEPFSEIEMRNIRDFVSTLDPVPVLSQCMHSYGQLWLWPYGYAHDAYPENWQEMDRLAIDACNALESVHGTVFDPINSADLCKLIIKWALSNLITIRSSSWSL